MAIYNLIEYSDNYSGTTASLWQYHKDQSKGPITDSNRFKFKGSFLGNINEDGIINAEIAVTLKYFSKFWKTIEIFLINCKVNLILTWSANCVISEGNRGTTFAIAHTKVYVLVVTLSANDYAKLLQQLKSGLK